MLNADRHELVTALAGAVYGDGPAQSPSIRVHDREEALGLDGTARFQNLVLDVSTPSGTHQILLTVVTPAAATQVPVMVGLNFRGNHTIDSDPAISLPDDREFPLHYDQFTGDPQPRGSYAGRWQLPTLIGRGYGVATACYLQAGPDSPELHTRGLYPLLQGAAPGAWGGLGMWAWLLQRILDVLLQESIGSAHIAFGHSRLGKAALWAALQDERFAGLIANNSGCMGASMSSAPGAETPSLLAEVRPYWFAEAFPHRVATGQPWPAADRLLAGISPRHVYVASAEDDAPADPAGERAAVELAREAEPGGSFGYHLREGGHDVTAHDWEQFLRYFDGAQRTTSSGHERPGPEPPTEGEPAH